jgi:hypothetical protein
VYESPPRFSDPFAAPPPFAAPVKRRRTQIFAIVGLILGLLVIGGVVVKLVGNGAPMRAEAQRYLDNLSAGNFDAAYQQWCPQDRAQYSLAQFRAQREYRTGEHGHVVGTSSSTQGDEVPYQTDQGPGVSHVARVDGHWYICPKGAALASAMENCACMSPAQHLEADIAGVLQGKDELAAPLSVVRCPAMSALEDGVAITCAAEAVNGSGYTVVATESNGATYTHVTVTPAL